jgi:hypothetical protein
VLIRSEDDIKKKYVAQKPGMEAGIWIEQMTTASPGNAGANAQASSITLICCAVDLSSVDSAANNEIVYAIERELKASPVFDAKTVQPSAQLSPVDVNGTFTFSITFAPQSPLEL